MCCLFEICCYATITVNKHVIHQNYFIIFLKNLNSIYSSSLLGVFFKIKSVENLFKLMSLVLEIDDFSFIILA